MKASKTNKTKEKRPNDESLLSKNHSKSIKFRLRVQQEQEAEHEIREHIDPKQPRYKRVY